MYERHSYTQLTFLRGFSWQKKNSLYTTGPNFREILGVHQLKYAFEIQNCSQFSCSFAVFTSKIDISMKEWQPCHSKLTSYLIDMMSCQKSFTYLKINY